MSISYSTFQHFSGLEAFFILPARIRLTDVEEIAQFVAERFPLSQLYLDIQGTQSISPEARLSLEQLTAYLRGQGYRVVVSGNWPPVSDSEGKTGSAGGLGHPAAAPHLISQKNSNNDRRSHEQA